MDGVDMASILFGTGKSRRETMLYYRGDELFAVRKGPFKAHFQTAPGYAGNRVQETFEKHEPPWLFQLENDPSEKFDVAKDHPDVIADILRVVEEHRAKLVPGKPQY